MMKEVRRILTQRHSVMLIASHLPIILPVILQETMVCIVKRGGDRVTFASSAIEIFGAIEAEAFDLTTDRTQYFETIDEVYSTTRCDEADTVKKAIHTVEDAMDKQTGHPLHHQQIHQAPNRSYVEGKKRTGRCAERCEDIREARHYRHATALRNLVEQHEQQGGWGGSDAKHNAVSEEERTAIMPTMWT